MKRFKKATILVLALVFSGVNVAAQTSDYQVKKEFEETYQELKTSVQSANSTSEIDDLQEKISDLEENYTDHESLLDDALYPQTFSGNIEDLKKFARSSESKLMVIEDQSEKLEKLSDELASYQNEVDRLNDRTDSLRTAVQESEGSERDLSTMVQQYRQSIEERDEYMLNMIDSLFITYKDLQTDEIQELSDEDKQRLLADADNPLAVIQSVVDENIQILKGGGNSLETEDYLRMYVVQSRFAEVWDQIGSDLVNLYGGNKKAEWENNIENSISDWHASSAKNMWTSIDEYLEENEIELGAFDNNESFYREIEAFVSQATNASQDKVLTDENYEDFQAFYDIWNSKIKSDWGKFVQEGEVLTMNQISTIDNEMMSWKEHAQPRSFLIPILFGLSLLTIIGLIIVIARR